MYKSRLPRIASEIQLLADAGTRAGAELVAQRAKARVPVNTGRLSEAIHVDHDGPADYSVVAGDSSAFYGHIVEHGGVHHSPRPFLVPALEESRAEVVSLVAASLRKLL